MVADDDWTPCPKCDDSGFQEFVSGGIWTGEHITRRLEVCDCLCGDDVRRCLAKYTPHKCKGNYPP